MCCELHVETDLEIYGSTIGVWNFHEIDDDHDDHEHDHDHDDHDDDYNDDDHNDDDDDDDDNGDDGGVDDEDDEPINWSQIKTVEAVNQQLIISEKHPHKF